MRTGYTTPVRTWILLVGVFLIAGSLIGWLTELFKERLLKETYSNAAVELASNASSLSLSINRRLLLSEGLKAFVDAELVADHQVDRKRFESFASNFMKNFRGVRNLSIYPDGVAQFVYPYRGNEQLLGVNIFDHPNPVIRMNAERTRGTRNVTIVGPFELIQGGLGILTRQSVFIDDQFWGFVSVVVDLPPILQEAGLFLENKGIELAVRADDGVIYGSADVFSGSYLLEQVRLPEGYWELAAVPKAEKLASIGERIWSIRAIGLFVLLMLIYFLYMQATQKAKLRVMVQEQTASLVVANRELEGKEQALRFLAYHDSVTGLPNRIFFQEKLSETLKQAKQNDQSFAVLFLDLDQFKLINDTLGHAFGDLLLREVGRRLSLELTNGESLARIGGDEFTIIVPNIEGICQARNAAQQVLNLFQNPFPLKDVEHFISPSIGIAIFPDHGEDISTLLSNADMAMYRAKMEGKNGYRFYDPAISPDFDTKMDIKNSLRRALERNEFELHYQPQIEIKSGRIVGLEALIRWYHPKLGMVPPSRFIPIAEETGLIVQIGEWVLRTACLQSQAWQSAGHPVVKMAVNLSARQIQQPDLVEQIQQILTATGINPADLELEITENMAMQDNNLNKLSELRSMGITISIDDFGTQYSSLSYLKRLPMNKIKIDRSFVDGISKDAKDEAIVSAMLLVARNLDLKVVAEGVETIEQYSFLQSHQCDDVQGYLFYKPQAAEEMEKIWRDHSAGL